MSDVEKDTAAILEVHDGWFESNLGLVAESMLPFFPEGEGYLQFNLNGFTYNGVADKARLWRNLNAIGVDIVRIAETVPPTVQVFGDVALLTCEAEAELVLPTATGTLETPGPPRSGPPSSTAATTAAAARTGGSGTCTVSPSAPEGALKYGTE